MMGFRMMLLMAMGLSSMYMLHLLAMDFMRIRRVMLAASNIAGPAMAVGRVILRGKREINSTGLSSSPMPVIEDLKEQLNLTSFTEDMIKLNWNRVINNDPLGCLPSLVCQIVSGIEKNTTEAQDIREFIDYSNRYHWLPKPVRNAYVLGLKFTNSSDKCYSEYPFCIYSAKTMLKILKWFLDNSS